MFVISRILFVLPYWLLLKMSNKRRDARVSRARRQGGVHNILLMNLARDVVVLGMVGVRLIVGRMVTSYRAN